MLEFKDMESKYIAESVELAIKEYKEEQKKCSQLIKEDFCESLTNLVSYLFSNKYGKVAVEDGKVIGYIAFAGPMDGFFGNVKGIFSPLGGSAFAGKDRGKLASMLFEQVGNEMILEGICSVALSRYAHDEEIGKSFVMNGFGIRCSDAIMRLSERNRVSKLDKKFTFCELKQEDKLQVGNLRQKLDRHLGKAPIFMASHLECYYDWYERNDIRVFAIRDSNNVLGFLSTQSDAETFVTEHKSMVNICGAYVDKKYRGSGIINQLLEFVCMTHEEEGVEYLGVDCETLNPTAYRFWPKNFANYTYSYARRIDERIIGFQARLDEEWGKEK